jgi:outer membrane protein insertion porin family
VIRRFTPVALAVLAAGLAPRRAAAQGGGGSAGGGRLPDSIAVLGNQRVTRQSILLTAALVGGRVVTYRDIAHAVLSLYGTGQFDDVRIEQDTAATTPVLAIRVRERPLLVKWAVRGVNRLGEHSVRDRVQLTEGRPIDPAAVERARGRIDSLYRANGYYLARVRALRVYEGDSTRVRVVYDVDEGRRVAIARMDFQGNAHFPDRVLAGQMSTRPEGFWWWRDGEFDDEKLRADLQENLPAFYGGRGFADFQVLDDTLMVNDSSGKATLVIRVSEGDPYRVGAFEVVGNRRFSTEQVEMLNPFRREPGQRRPAVVYFNQVKWDDATRQLQSEYSNDGYIYAQVRPEVTRRAGPDGKPVVDLRWVINEGQPAIVNKVEIAGNDVTRERVIRDAIVLIPGDVFRQDALIKSYQNISNLGFFNQPLAIPETRPANDQGDVDVVFHVSEKRTGNVNFGASIGQGTGLGGFLGLDEPNLFGQGKRGQFQWQFGKNINDFNLSYTDPAVRESRISGTVGIHNTRLRYQIADLGRLRRRGGNVQFGFPVFNDRYTRLFASYALDEQTFEGSASNAAFQARFGCSNCLRSSLGLTITRDTRVELPFPTGGTMASVGISQSGGLLGGRGDFQRIDLEGRWYAPVAQLGRRGVLGGGPRFVLGFSARSGFVFGNSPFFDQLFFMGGTQFGIPLRGYDEFSITPNGFDPNASSSGASTANAFGKAYVSMTGEFGLRLSQMFYVDLFYDAGNLWARAAEFNPTRLFRGAGIGASVVSPLGPLGLDWAYGFDKTDVFGRPAPGWKLHFKLGNFF